MLSAFTRKKNKQHYLESMEFICEISHLLYLQTENMDWTTYDAVTSYDFGSAVWDIRWHIRISGRHATSEYRGVNISLFLSQASRD